MEANYKVFKKLTIECTTDSSEAIMFSEGGKHILKLDPESIFADKWDEIEITFQVEGGMMGTHKWMKKEAEKYREYWDTEVKIPPVKHLDDFDESTLPNKGKNED